MSVSKAATVGDKEALCAAVDYTQGLLQAGGSASHFCRSMGNALHSLDTGRTQNFHRKAPAKVPSNPLTLAFFGAG